jgi:hypothetical protein
MEFNEALTKFKQDIRDGVSALSLAADGAAQSVVEANKERDARVAEIQALDLSIAAKKVEKASLEGTNQRLQESVAALKAVLANVKV